MNNNVDFLTRKRCPSSRSSVKRLGTFLALVCFVSAHVGKGLGASRRRQTCLVFNMRFY
ncbi:hypothetical protein SAMN05216198_0703 [Halopseudomonas litoralis]|uniref:Uncharacterized protein n=1 Tax=Halopseudomonas litoralis TaxID=797277 RepID=A0A1H1MRW2_9GAMM|nr:hypothetical protein SAMN05216198_0703 [Halopseudomonas litoralis]